ncbi:MAG TPA: DUF1499 domain-containing protein [Candidatus Kryptonia bacterium]|nr:DUF1499 domain-containing protein [Candidatus Kryptonia bacterium]
MAQRASGAARWTVRLGVAAIVAFVVGPLLAHLGVLPALAGFVVFDLGGLLGVIAAITGIVALVRGAGGAALAGLIPAAIVAALFIKAAAGAGNVPRINDITTNTQQAPEFVKAGAQPANAGRDMKYPGESFAQQQRQGYPTLAGLPLSGSPDEVYRRVVATAKQMPTWEITRDDPAAHALEGVDTTWLFRFHDDFVIEVRPRDGGSIVEMRSKSRDGKGDTGTNAKRIEAFFAKLKS